MSSGEWADSRSLESGDMKPFYNVRERLSVVDGLVIYMFDASHVRLVVPEQLRGKVTENLHSGHQGLDSMLRRARQSVYWPGLEGDLAHDRNRCATFEQNSPSQPKEPMTPTQSPEYPFQHVAMDLFQVNGSHYLAYIDRLTGWLEIAHLKSGTTSNNLIFVLHGYFARWGDPRRNLNGWGTEVGECRNE